MKFIDFCTDVTAVGVTVVLSLVLIGGVASRSDVASSRAVAEIAEPPAAAAEVFEPNINLPRPDRAAGPSAPAPLDLADLERSLDTLLGPASSRDLPVVEASPGNGPLFDLAPAAEEAVTDWQPTVDWEDVLSDALALPPVPSSDRPNTNVPAPVTRPLIAVPREPVVDFMAELLDDSGVEELPAPPSASRPLGRVR